MATRLVRGSPALSKKGYSRQGAARDEGGIGGKVNAQKALFRGFGTRGAKSRA